MLVSQLLLQARETLQDLHADRYSDDRLLRALNLGILDLRRVRPDHFIGTYGSPPFQATNLTDELPFADEIMPSLTKYIVGWVELADDEYSEDGRAAAMLGAFGTDIGVRR